uniref:Uncharacterized protein n=1 Tax=Neobodo designis TaxID=312471 RepID=A0A6U4P1K4_NEODS
MWSALTGRGRTGDQNFHDCHDETTVQQSSARSILSWVTGSPTKSRQQQQASHYSHEPTNYSSRAAPNTYGGAQPSYAQQHASHQGSLASYSRTPSHGSVAGRDAHDPIPRTSTLSPIRGGTPSFRSGEMSAVEDAATREFIDRHLSRVKGYYEGRIRELESALVAAQRDNEHMRAGSGAAGHGSHHQYQQQHASLATSPHAARQGLSLTDMGAHAGGAPGHFSFVASVRSEIAGQSAQNGHHSLLDQPPRSPRGSPLHLSGQHPADRGTSPFRYR